MKWLLAIGLVTTSLFTGSYPYGEGASASDRVTRSVEVPSQSVTLSNNAVSSAPTTTKKSSLILSMLGADTQGERTLLQQQYRQSLEASANTEKVNSVIEQLKSRIGKTWYVFSGHTPQGWDCSGLVYWAYEQLGVPLEHSATKQGHSGYEVRTPKVGDIVVFGYKGSAPKYYYHAAIYIGDGKVIHAGFRKGTTTQIISLDDPSFEGSTIAFRRVIETN